MRPWFVILKQVQDDELWGEEVGSTSISGITGNYELRWRITVTELRWQCT